MKLPKLHLACSDDTYRPVMSHVLITKEETVATNAQILVVHKTKDLFPEQFIDDMPKRMLIHRRFWADICKNHLSIYFNNETNQVEIMRKFKYENIKYFYPIVFESEIGIYPDYTKVFPKKQESKKEIALNPLLLKNLYKAMNTYADSTGLKLEFYDNYGAIIAKLNPDTGVKGMIMPIMINE